MARHRETIPMVVVDRPGPSLYASNSPPARRSRAPHSGKRRRFAAGTACAGLDLLAWAQIRPVVDRVARVAQAAAPKTASQQNGQKDGAKKKPAAKKTVKIQKKRTKKKTKKSAKSRKNFRKSSKKRTK